MGWRDEWYPRCVAALIQLRGEGSLGSDGVRMPALTGLELIAAVGQVIKPLAAAIRRFQEQQGVVDPTVVTNTQLINEDNERMYNAQLEGGAWLSGLRKDAPIADYLAGYAPNKSARWERMLYGEGVFKAGEGSSIVLGGDTFTFTVNTSVFFEAYLFSFLRTAIGDYDRAIEAAASACRSGPTTIAPVADAQAFWSAMRALCVDLDVLDENPPVPPLEQVRGALGAALDKSAAFAGEAAAVIADKAGDIAGRTTANFLEGFLASGSLMSFAVAGIAVYLFLN